MAFTLDIVVPPELDWRGAKWPHFVGDYRYARSGKDNVLHFSELDWVVDFATLNWEDEIITRIDTQRACDFKTGRWMRFRTYTAEEELARHDPWAWVKKYPVKVVGVVKVQPPSAQTLREAKQHRKDFGSLRARAAQPPKPPVILPPTPPLSIMYEAQRHRLDMATRYTPPVTTTTDIHVTCLACHANGVKNDYATFLRPGFARHLKAMHHLDYSERRIFSIFEYAATQQYIHCIRCGLFFQTNNGLNNHWSMKHIPNARFANGYDYRHIVARYQDQLEEPL